MVGTCSGRPGRSPGKGAQVPPLPARSPLTLTLPEHLFTLEAGACSKTGSCSSQGVMGLQRKWGIKEKKGWGDHCQREGGRTLPVPANHACPNRVLPPFMPEALSRDSQHLCPIPHSRGRQPRLSIRLIS